jgi:hypothetical protein
MYKRLPGAYQIVTTSFSLIAVGFSQRSIIKISVGFSQKGLLAKAVIFCHYNPSAKADGNKELSKKLKRQFDMLLNSVFAANVPLKIQSANLGKPKIKNPFLKMLRTGSLFIRKINL